MVVTVSQNSELTNPEYLFSFTHIFSKENVTFIPADISMHKNRYDEFYFVEGTGLGEIDFPYEGLYLYSISEQPQGSGNLNPALAYNVVENGEAQIIIATATTMETNYDIWISPNEDNSNIIFAPDELNPAPAPIPSCPSGLTGSCPTLLTRYSPTNSIYYKSTGTTADFLTNLSGCSAVQIAMDETRMFITDGCSNYYQYDYTISSGGCFNLTFVDKWNVWASSGATPNASYTMGIYDSNNLIIGESAQFVGQTGSTLYLYNLTTSGITKWLEIGNGAQVYNVYYNTGNTQTILSYGSASGGTGYYQLYSGSTNPQLLSQIPGTYSNAGSTMYFSGNTAIAVNVAGLQFQLDFVNSTVTLLENQSGIPIYYVGFNDGFNYLSNIAQKASCYTFDIPYQPQPTATPTMTVTPSMTPTMTVTPSVTPTLTPTPSVTPPVVENPSQLGATWWVDFTDSNNVILDNSFSPPLTNAGRDLITNNFIFSASTATGPQYSGTGYNNTSGALLGGGQGISNALGTFSGTSAYTVFMNVNLVGTNYTAPVTSDDQQNYLNQQQGYRWFSVDNGFPPDSIRCYSFNTGGNSTSPEVREELLGSGWTFVAVRVYASGSDFVTELWVNGNNVDDTTNTGVLPIQATNPIFLLGRNDQGIHTAEAYFFDRALSDVDMTKSFNYFSSKYPTQ